jgi:CubicO group peptidase (beta-lactamase class C family)
MQHSDFLINKAYKILYAEPHIRRLNIEVSSVYPYNRMHGPSSTLHSSAAEMCNWAIANMNRGRFKSIRILDSSSYDQLWKPYTAAYNEKKIGLSWFLREQDGNLIIEHGGGDLGFGTYLSMMPRRMMAVIVLSNHDYSPVGAIRDAVWAILLGSEPKMPKIPILITLSRILIKGNISDAIEKYKDLKTNHADEYRFNEAQLNILGYQLINAGRIEDAIEIFKLNVKQFPEAFNTYDSLGEAYTIAGEKELAIKNYQKSIEINPENENGKQMLKKLQTE